MSKRAGATTGVPQEERRTRRRHLEDSPIERAYKSCAHATEALTSFCSDRKIDCELHGVDYIGGVLLSSEEELTDEFIAKVVEEQNPNLFKTKEDKVTAGKLALEDARCDELVTWESHKMMVEDRGWPHRSWLYFDRATKHHKVGPYKDRNPQKCFAGLGLTSKQEGDDVNRYVPDKFQSETLPTKGLIVVGRWVDGTPLKYELALDENTTVKGVLNSVCSHWGCDPKNSILGYHGYPFWGRDFKLIDRYGTVQGTVLHLTVGFESPEKAMEEVAKAKKRG